MPENGSQGSWFLFLAGLSVLVAVASAFYFLYFKKQYDFIVEAACDPLEEQCFQRDCTEGFCPPNGLSEFKRYSLRASDFASCTGGNCEAACEEGVIACTQIPCTEDLETGESCSL